MRRPKWTLALVLFLIALAATEMRHLRLGMRLIDMVPEEHPHTLLFTRIAALFGVEKTVIVGLRARDGELFTAAALTKVVAAARALEGLPGVVPGSVLSLADPRVKTARMIDGALETTALLSEVPTEAGALAELRRRTLASTLYRDLVVAADGSAATLIADFHDSVPDTEIHRQLVALADSFADANTEVVIGGAPVLGAHLQAYSARVAFVLPLTFLVIALVHYEAFRTIQAMVLPLVTALASVVLALGVMGALGFPIDPWNATTPVVILAVAAGHAVQMLKRYYEELGRTGDNRRAVVEAMVAVGPVMLAAGGIAAAGFLSLATFGVRSVRVFGLLLALGVAAALVVEMTLVPACRALLPPPRRREREREAEASVVTRAVSALSRAVVRHPLGTIAVAVLLALVSLGGIARLRVDNSLRGWFYAGSAARVDDDRLNHMFGGTATLHLLVEGDMAGSLEDPRVVAAVADVADELAREPGVGKVVSYVDFLREMHRTIGAGDGLPSSRELVAQYLLLYAIDLGPEELGWLLDPPHRHAVVAAFSRRDESRAFRRLIDRLRELGTERFAGLPARLHVAAGSIGLQVAMNESVVREKLANLAVVGAVVFVLSSFIFRSVVGGLLVALPLALAVLAGLGAMGWTETWLSMSTSAIAAMSVSIGADFAIYLLFRTREEARAGRPPREAIECALGSAGQATGFVSSAIIAGYLTLASVGFRTWTQVGGLTAWMTGVAAVSTLTVIPALVLLVRPRFLWGPR